LKIDRNLENSKTNAFLRHSEALSIEVCKCLLTYLLLKVVITACPVLFMELTNYKDQCWCVCVLLC